MKKHPSRKIPMLDLEVWVTPNNILHQFYQKPVSRTRAMSSRTAFSTTTKLDMLVAEGWRRLFNMSPNLPWEEKAIKIWQY